MARLRPLAALLAVSTAATALADPCGMVPPVYVGNDVPIARIGIQKTYVFHQDGVETFVIRPGFQGKVEEFGMLIPMPEVPALRKVSDNVFPHVAAAVDPPEVVVYANIFPRRRFRSLARNAPAAAEPAMSLAKDKVVVEKEEAVGMYEVAVLRAGSAAALNKWMDDHGYRYPDGMDAACEDYVAEKWCFVAVKTKVGAKDNVDPKPGMRSTNPNLPKGSTFDGHVQAMGFRFPSDELVVPMRLSTFNEGDLRNVVYVLSDKPMKIKSIPSEYVVRQIPGEELLKNVTEPLPLRIIGGTVKDLQPFQKQNLPAQRNPEPHNGAAKQLFASDLLAVAEGRLVHPHEETEKMLLRIGERLDLRGMEIDKLNEEALKKERDETVAEGLEHLKGMTLTVIDGNFPRQVLANQNLRFSEFHMPGRRNSSRMYDATKFGPNNDQLQGSRFEGELSLLDTPADEKVSAIDEAPEHSETPWAPAGLATVGLFGAVFALRRGGRVAAVLLATLALGMGSVAFADDADSDKALDKLENIELIDLLADKKMAAEAADEVIKRGKKIVPDLLGEAFEGNDVVLRGWAIVCLSEIGGKEAEQRLIELQKDESQPAIVRTWAAAGRVNMTETTEELLELAALIPQFPALGRPIGKRFLDQLAKEDDVSAEEMLGITLRVPQLQQSLAPAILALGPDKLVEAMATAKEQTVRRQAAAYLGTLAQQGEDKVPTAVVEAYAFDAKAKKLPWDGGPLFVPGIQWQKDDARALVDALVSWHLWCDVNNQKQAIQPIHNNLASIQLAAAAGYNARGPNGTEAWLRAWGAAVGKEGIRKILEANGVADEAKYKAILDGLK